MAADVPKVMKSLAEEYPQFVIKDGDKEYFDMRALMIHKGYIKEK
jgi:uncharacterized protein (UPF0216 family)